MLRDALFESGKKYVELTAQDAMMRNVNRVGVYGSFAAPLYDTGKLYEHAEIIADEKTLQIYVDGYILTLLYGRKPAPVPLAAISDWAKRKGLNPYAVKKVMEREGTTVYRAKGGARSEYITDEEARIDEAFSSIYDKLFDALILKI